MAKDARLTVRITAELVAWLGAEGDKRGLDKAAFARMVLFERMNGRRPIISESQEKRDLDFMDRGEPQEAPPWDDAPTVRPLPNVAEAVEAPDAEEMIQAALETAETHPRPSNEEPAASYSSGVRSITRPAVPYSKNLPSWLPR